MISNGTVQISLLEKEKVKISRITNRLRAFYMEVIIIVNVIKLKWEIIWTGGLPHLPGVPHLQVNKPTKGYTTLFAIFFKISNVSSHQLNSETYGPVSKRPDSKFIFFVWKA